MTLRDRVKDELVQITSSPLVQMVEEARRPSPWWLGWLIAVVIIVGGNVVGVALGGALLGSPSSSEPRAQYIEVFAFGITLLLLFVWVRFKEVRPFATLGFRPGRGWVQLPIGFVIGAAMMAAGVLLGLAVGQYAPGQSTHTLNGAAAVPALIPLVMVFVLQGTTEETALRGYMLQIGARQLPGWVAVLGSSVVFAVLHLDFAPLVMINIILYAVFACLVALRQGSLWLIGGIHAGWNYFQGNVFGLPVSGINYATSLLSIGPAPGSSTAVSGGAFGLEASVLGTIVLTAATAVAFVLFRRSSDPAGGRTLEAGEDPTLPRPATTTSGGS